MKLLVKLCVLAALIAVSFAVGYLTHRNEWVPLAWRGRVRALLAQGVQTGADNISGDRSGLRGALSRVVQPSGRDVQIGEWHPLRQTPGEQLDEGDLPDELAKAQAHLESLGYLQGYTPVTEKQGVTRRDTARSLTGYNLYSSGHAQQAYLIDMDGAVLHTWQYDYSRVWPDYSPPEFIRSTGHQNWRRLHLFSDGGLIALHDGIGLIKLDRDSNLVWSYRNGCHHDFEVQRDGTIYVLTREAKVIDWFRPEELVLEPTLSILDASGREQRVISLLECVRDSRFAPLLLEVPQQADLFHVNTIEVLDGRLADRNPAFKQGNILISIFTLDTIAVVDPEAEQVVWAMTGMWRRQHQPTILPSGNMMIFDNRGYRQQSRVLEFDPLTQEVFWSYEGSVTEPFYTAFVGSAIRLGNGNTLITESNNGRCFEVTRDHAIVWEFYNPHQVQRDGQILVSTLFECLRIDEDYVSTWLQR